jgi:hypothetical protein
LEAALAKLWGTECTWRIVDDTMQIRGGRGYETADSLRARGEQPEPVERFMRDARINTIFEGSSEIMRLFIAREMLDPHLKLGAAIFNSKLSFRDRAKSFFRAGLHYAAWYPTRWIPSSTHQGDRTLHPELAMELRAVERLGRKLSRVIFYSMLLHGPKLEKKQLVLGRLVDIGAELFAWSTAVSRAQSIFEGASHNQEEIARSIELARLQGSLSRETIQRALSGLFFNDDRARKRVADKILERGLTTSLTG